MSSLPQCFSLMDLLHHSLLWLEPELIIIINYFDLFIYFICFVWVPNGNFFPKWKVVTVFNLKNEINCNWHLNNLYGPDDSDDDFHFCLLALRHQRKSLKLINNNKPLQSFPGWLSSQHCLHTEVRNYLVKISQNKCITYTVCSLCLLISCFLSIISKSRFMQCNFGLAF